MSEKKEVKNEEVSACELASEHLKKEKDMAVLFIMKGCEYCHEAEKYLFNEMQIPDNLVENLPKEIAVVDVDECGDMGLNIEKFPTLIRFSEGKIIGKVEGLDKEGFLWLMTMKRDLDSEGEGNNINGEQNL